MDCENPYCERSTLNMGYCDSCFESQCQINMNVNKLLEEVQKAQFPEDTSVEEITYSVIETLADKNTIRGERDIARALDRNRAKRRDDIFAGSQNEWDQCLRDFLVQ